jgi:hypothetical protein
MGRKKKTYGFDNRKEFVDLILSMRAGRNKTTYKGIAVHMQKKGYRNRNEGDITPQFIGNILNRWTKKGKSLV